MLQDVVAGYNIERGGWKRNRIYIRHALLKINPRQVLRRNVCAGSIIYRNPLANRFEKYSRTAANIQPGNLPLRQSVGNDWMLDECIHAVTAGGTRCAIRAMSVAFRVK